MSENALLFFVLALSLGYVYAFVSGFTDAGNSIATSVGSRALHPLIAVLMAGLLALVGGLTGTAVAKFIASGFVDPEIITLATVVAGLASVMSWSLFTYLYGLPVSETHGLIGGLIGAALVTSGEDVVEWGGLEKIGIAIVASPTLGFIGGLVIITILYWLIHFVFHGGRVGLLRPLFTNLQRASALFMAFSHGRNDAQKPMGMIALAVALHQEQALDVSLWMILSSSLVLGLGIAYGGWRIIRTLGMRITDLGPVHGFAAESSGTLVLQGASVLGIPVSTTHTTTSAIVGVGATRRLSGVAWGLTRDIVVSWILTVSVTISLGAGYMLLLKGLIRLLTD